MYDILSELNTPRRKFLTSPSNYGMGEAAFQLRCWNCNKLLGTGKVTNGYIEIKCTKCGQFVTVGLHTASLATAALEISFRDRALF